MGWGGRMATSSAGGKDSAASDASELQDKLSKAKFTEAKLHVQVHWPGSLPREGSRASVPKIRTAPLLSDPILGLWAQVEELTDRLKIRLAKMDQEHAKSTRERPPGSAGPGRLNSHLSKQDVEWFRATLGPAGVITDPERLAPHNTCVDNPWGANPTADLP